MKMKFHELLVIWSCIDAESDKQLKALEKPRFIRRPRLFASRSIIYIIRKFNALKRKISGKVETPANLNDISIGQVLALSQSNDMFFPFRELLHLSNEQIAMLDVTEAVGFINFVRAELKRINELLTSAKAEPTPEEKQAGIELIGRDVGPFGMLDYIAKRQRITHDAAADMPWRRVYAIMMLDRDNELFRRRLMEIYKKKRK